MEQIVWNIVNNSAEYKCAERQVLFSIAEIETGMQDVGLYTL